MEQNRKPLNKGEIAKIVDVLRSGQKYSEEAVALAKEDLEYGLSEQEVMRYLGGDYHIGQMQVMSRCLREGYPEEFLSLFNDHHLSGHQMQVAADYYEKGVPVEKIREELAKNSSPVDLRNAYRQVLDEMEKTKTAAEPAPEYIRELVTQMEKVVDQIRLHEEKYGNMEEKLAKEITQKEEMIDDQQNQLNQAYGTIARLRESIEKKEKERMRMEDKIHALEEKETDGEHVEDKKEMPENKTPAVPQPNVIPVYYSVPIIDTDGKIIGSSRMERKEKHKGRFAEHFARLCLKKKSRADIVKLVVNGELAPEQLVQIKSAMEKGLTENQLVELINSRLSAERMKEIIEIAVLENSMTY